MYYPTSKICLQVFPKVQSWVHFFSVFILMIYQDCEVLMYADDTVIFGWGKNNVEVAARLTKVMVDVSDWLQKCCLQLNTSKAVAMFFFLKPASLTLNLMFLFLIKESRL